MKTYTKEHSIFGETLFAQRGKLTVGIPLKFGIRIAYLSYDGSENLFFEQPTNMTDLTTEQGWRVRGGHRLWVAPEGEESYYPDNQDITYELLENSIVLHQSIDPWLNVKKSIKLTFLSDNELQITHTIKNVGTQTKRCSVWSITSLAANGTEYIPLPQKEFSYSPIHKITSWFYTDLGDSRAEYHADHIVLHHSAAPNKYKIGVSHPAGPITYTNKGVVFEKSFPIFANELYPDGDVSFETFMCDHMVEIESLSPIYDIPCGEFATHTEYWKVNKEK